MLFFNVFLGDTNAVFKNPSNAFSTGIFSIGVNLINALVTLGFGLKAPLFILKSFFGNAYSCVVSDRRLLSGSLAIYFSATSFWNYKECRSCKML